MPEQTQEIGAAVTRAEVELLLCCARTRTNQEMSQRIREAAQKEIDWVQFFRLALDHDILSLTYQNLNRICPDIVPCGVLEPLRVRHEAGVAKRRRLTEELVSIVGFLGSRGISAVPYKGPALAVRLYGDLSLRGFSDLDIVICERDVLRARQLLIDRGYAPTERVESGEVNQHLRKQHEMPFCRADGKVHLDLHWRYTSRSTCLAGDPERFLQQLETIPLAGKEVQSMRLETYLLVLSMHAAKHRWSQLKLICDIAEILAVPDLDWDHVLREAGELGLRRALGTSLLLAQGVLEAAVPPKLAQLEIDGSARALASQARTRLFEEPGETWRAEPDYTFELELRERFRDRTKIFMRYFLPKLKPNERDRAFLPLPRSLSVGYYVVRPIRLALKKMGRISPLH
jgi:hypothetical protein